MSNIVIREENTRASALCDSGVENKINHKKTRLFFITKLQFLHDFQQNKAENRYQRDT